MIKNALYQSLSLIRKEMLSVNVFKHLPYKLYCHLQLKPYIIISVIQLTIAFDSEVDMWYKIKDASEQILCSEDPDYNYEKFLNDCCTRIEARLQKPGVAVVFDKLKKKEQLKNFLLYGDSLD
jgi:hypothetical protein